MTAVHMAMSLGYPVFRTACVFLMYEKVSAFQIICFRLAVFQAKIIVR